MVYFKDIGTIDINFINWRTRFSRNNQSYQVLITVCYLIVKGLLQTTSNGNIKLRQFLDEQRMCRLFEKFILAYYKKHYPNIKTNPSQILWALDDDICDMLPIMQSDIMMSYKNKILIIDAKYYEHITQINYGHHTIHSNNLYQIFTYVKNKAICGKEVSGLLLYAQTDEVIQPDKNYMMSGNQIGIKTLNLNCTFLEITKQLNAIADNFLQ